jgi:hypothetical protein
MNTHTLLRGLSQFRDEFRAIEAEGPDADPPPPDPDVAGLDVALANPGRRPAFPPLGAEVVWLQFHGLP